MKIINLVLTGVACCHREIIQSKLTNSIRNDIAHRGRLNDPEIKSLQSTKATIINDRFGLLNRSHITDEEYNKRMSELNKEVIETSVQKRDKLKVHLQKTLAFYAEIGTELGKISHELLANKKV